MKKNKWRIDARNQVDSKDLNNIPNYDINVENLFKLHIPDYFKTKIDFKNIDDPLLLQVLPSVHENYKQEDELLDPVGDLQASPIPGLIHKYYGRVLLIATGTCAINCRYCFRRNFPYSQNYASANNWQQSIEYIKKNSDIHEVILSGGDPLMLSTKVLNNFSSQLQKIKHIKTVRIHTRMPLVTPSRITDNFLNWLNNLPFKKVMVLHCNHPNELSGDMKSVFESIKETDTLLLNQSVLLKKVNDNSETLVQLSHRLFQYGILPYYLNQLDKAQGTSHFRVSNKKAIKIHNQLLEKLSGYLVPKLVIEISGKMNKSPLF